MTNPFAPNVPAQPAQQPQGGNPFAQPAAPQQPAYAPPAPQQPQYAPPAPQQPAYAPPAPMQPQQQPYAPQNQTPAFGPITVNAAPPPPPTGDGKGAKFENLYGRLVMMFPLSVSTEQRNPQFVTAEQRAAGNTTEERLVATIVVLDDGQGGMQPVQWGGNPAMNQPHTDSAPLPYVRKAMWVSQSRIVGQARPFLPQQPGGAPGALVGRLVRTGPERNAPWYLTTATPQEIELAQTYIGLVQAQQYPHPLA
jgi:hypothetical protein